MFVHDFMQVDMPLATARWCLESGEAWLAPFAAGAYREGEQLLIRTGPAQGGLLTKQVRMTVGETRDRGDGLVVPIRWEATGAGGLFPALEADIEFAPLGPKTTVVTLWGTYDPPLHGVGSTLDRWLFHRLAEATVRAFLGRMAEALQEATVSVGHA